MKFSAATAMSIAINDLYVRPATPDDAERLIAHVLAMIEEAADSLPMAPGEFTMTVEQERQFLADVAAADNSLYLIAEVVRAGGEAELVGILNYAGGKRRATRHTAVLGISVRRAWQGQGVGRALMNEAIRRARATQVLRRLELSVYADNHRAIALYESVGFVTEGVKRRAIYRADDVIDERVMGLVW